VLVGGFVVLVLLMRMQWCGGAVVQWCHGAVVVVVMVVMVVGGPVVLVLVR
jgi:hypothetical protein